MKIYYTFAIFLAVLILNINISAQQKMEVKPRSFSPVIPNFTFTANNNTGYVSDGIYVMTQFPNIRVLPGSYNQSSPFVTLSPDGSKMFIGANTDYGMGYYYSLNSGVNWAGSDILPGSVYYSSNPAASYNNSGALFYNYNDDYIVVDKSLNYGVNWSGRIVVPSSSLYDMNTLVCDRNLSSPYNGRIYTAWSNFNFNQPAIFFSYSNDNGATFSSPQQIGLPLSGHYEQGVRIAIAPNGDVYCFWASVNIGNNNIEDKIAFVKSTTGGASFSSPVYPFVINGIRGYFNPTGIRLNSFPSLAIDNLNGNIYVCWSQKNLSPAGNDADVLFSASNNGGNSFSAPVRVNDDALNNGKSQFLPCVTVDNTNRKICVSYYDNRDTYMPDSMNVYCAISTNSGSSFTNIKISDHAFRPYPLNGYSAGYYADYNSIEANNNIVYPVWTDNRNGNAQIYTTKAVLNPYILHLPVKDNENVSGTYNVTAEIKTFGTPLNTSEVKLFYGIGSITTNSVMTNSGGNNWSASINGNGSPSTYFYYIKATDINNGESTLPVGAPANLFSFKTGVDIQTPIITHSGLNYSNWINFPDTINAVVSDNTGIDSVWVRWYRNDDPGTMKSFKLNNSTGDLFSAAFNSSTQQIQPNDSIYYRIIAQDNSSAHNRDSSGIFTFKVYSTVNIKLGKGNLSTPYPFRTFYMDSRTQMLYTADEISTYWGNNQGRIMGIAFEVLNTSPQVINGLTIKIKNTSENTLTSFSNSGFTTYWSGSTTINSTGWKYFPNMTPFIWDGTSNLLLEVCYDNNSININSAVEASGKPGLVLHQYADLPSGNGCTDLTNGALQNNRPNLYLSLNSILPVGDENRIIPSEYSLSQNFPNPFNPVTKINYAISKSGLVEIKIYDILGKEIRTLVNEKKQAGFYNIEFNASDLSSGVYFCRMIINGYTDIRKMILIK